MCREDFDKVRIAGFDRELMADEALTKVIQADWKSHFVAGGSEKMNPQGMTHPVHSLPHKSEWFTS
jgi:hypothetical protein